MFEDITPESIKAAILAEAGESLETREGSFLDSMAGPAALEIWKVYQAMNAVVSIAFVDESSGGYLDLEGAKYGITRKPGAKARCTMTLTGTAGATVPAGTVFVTPGGLEFALTEAEQEEYQSLLNMDGTGIMGYIEIPNIKLSLPIYHGTEESVLQIAVGHLDWSALPVGGEGTHCVLSGHRGLPSAKLFTNLDQLREGDTFTLRVLDEVLCYEVDQIRIVEPQDTSALLPEPGQDLCTLVTCTPYGVNTHRLLVRGHRIETPDSADAIRVTSDAMQIEPILVAPAVGVPLVLLAVAVLLLSDRRRRRKN